MKYAFDLFGWYTGQVADDAARATTVAPLNTSLDATPGALHSCWTGSIWVEVAYVVPATVDPHAQARTDLVAEIKARRDARKSGGVLAGGKWFHSDTESRIQQLGLVMMGATVPPAQWKTKDGTFVTMSQTLAGQIFSATAAADMAVFSLAETLIAQVHASADPRTVDISAGWPATFGE